MLRGHDMEIVGQANSPQRSIDGILASQPDVVVLDVKLEGGLGVDVLRAVRLVAPQTKFIIFSINSGPAYRKMYRIEGAARFLDKNAEFDQLAQVIESISPARLH